MNASYEMQCRDFASDLRRLRQECGLTQENFARMLGVKAPFLSAVEHARKPPPNPRMAARISCLLEMQVQEAAAFEKNAGRARLAWKEWLNAKSNTRRDLACRGYENILNEPTFSIVRAPLVLSAAQQGECRFEVTIQVRPVSSPSTERSLQM